MEISLFSKCIKDLVVENDRVDVPYLGSFTAEMMPASYSDRQTKINPPYRKLSFRKCDIPLEGGSLLLDKVAKETGVSLQQAGVELGWCLSRLSSELESSKICKLPSLGLMRANARNEFYFVPDDDLDIWADGIGFEAVSIRLSEKPAAPVQSAVPVQVPSSVQPAGVHHEAAPEAGTQAAPEEETSVKVRRRRRGWLVVAIVVLVLLLLFIAAAYVFPEQMSPVLDPLLYSREELELLRS